MRKELIVRWEKPPGGWIKLNTDGASRGNPGIAAAGGVFRDDKGESVCGSGANIGIATAAVAELWGLLYGLQIAWDRGWRRVFVELDSMLVLEVVQKGVDVMHPLFSLIFNCQGFINRDWVVRFGHVWMLFQTLPLLTSLVSICVIPLLAVLGVLY